MNLKQIITPLLVALGLIQTQANACTGITLKAKDDSLVVARTIEWGGSEIDNQYVIVPRNHEQQSLLPDGTQDGLKFNSMYGFAGLAVVQPEFVVDGTNEAGLSAGLFYFPDYGEYQKYNPDNKENTIADLQLVSWILSNFSTIEQVKNAISGINIVQLDPRSSTVHWRITENTGKQVILEIVDGKPVFYDSKLGVLTNSPGYEWQIQNLNNYVNLIPGSAGPVQLGAITLKAFGAGSGFLGLPGDFTPPSRFVRAAFFQTYSIQQDTGYAAAMDAFHILNNFDVPLGIEFPVGQYPVNMPSATQWTIATDLTNRMIYYHTMYNRTIRSIDLDKIDFANVEYQYYPLDKTKAETIIPVEIK